ncbi:trypsin-like serine protease [Nannocystis sp.]|uniref:S1 family peptidase n=1 Tax=Nannocystis sp. TaxID=1962667 RepID=UPI0025EFB6A3|nr:trypsin-like serine protease [Nannocystis sp.]MBK7825352.1 trypsin-like serine protease [Nannocystis sp.]
MSGLGVLVATMTVALPLSTGVPTQPVPIVGGEAAEGFEWASVVAVLTPDPDDKTFGHLCSGTLVAPRIVLTAAHCIPPNADASKIEVYFGTQMTSHQRATGKRFGLHPDACVDECEPEAMDFAFVEIAQDVAGVKFIPPLTSQADWDFAMVRQQPITLVGFGAVRDDEVKGAAPLREDERGYKRSVVTIIDKFTAHGEEVIAGSPGKDTCGGDSGGPAFVQVEDGSWRQVGVTSRGVRPCGSGYGYYGVPYFALTWLREETGVDLLPEGCKDGDCLDTVSEDGGCGCREGGARGGGSWLLALGLLWRRRRS